MSHTLVGREIVVPGSTSNLGPGFDALGLALQIHLRVRVTRIDARARRVVRFDFVGTPAPDDNYIARGFHALVGHVGLDEWPGLEVEVRSEIPMKSGLGSSAAAIVAGLRLGEAVAGARPLDELLSLAAALDGHPDNTSASLLGGFVTSCVADDGRVAALASPWPDHLRLIVATPAVTLDTRRARAALPARVPFPDAVANVQRTALLVHALAADDHVATRNILREAFRDRLHQSYREVLVPCLTEALALTHPSLVGVFLSGSGPSVAAVVDDATGPVVQALSRLYRRRGVPCAVREMRASPPFG